jgi:hypothetical protein
MRKINIVVMTAVTLSLLSSASSAADKNWTSQGDGTDWFDPANWLSLGTPSEGDNAKVDLRDASVDVGQSFDAASLTVGGKKNSTVNVSNFVTGEVIPDTPADNAMLIRRDGKLTLKGSAGKVTMKGRYKDSEEIIPEEPGLMLYVK